jgi:hypothetical protein
VEEVDRRGVATVLAADPGRDAGIGGAGPIQGRPDQLADTGRVEGLER